MLGVEMLLHLLNQSGANTNYIKDYYYGKDENGKMREKVKPKKSHNYETDMLHFNKLLYPGDAEGKLKKQQQQQPSKTITV